MIDIKMFCDPSRAKLSKPWSKGGYTYASDGKILIRVPRIEGIAEGGGPDVSKLILDYRGVEVWHPLPDLTGIETHRTCPDCDGAGKYPECPDCDGDREVKYTYEARDGETHTITGDCPVCESGSFDVVCKTCDGDRKVENRFTVEIADTGLRITVARIARLATLPNVTLGVSATDQDHVRIRFDGGCGITQTMRTTEQ